ncbi:MAG TPA: TaqI-like C-terminal specificity domain-containing protein, partial [Smithellaceae bacterium]|nr:TaqI-like C-terminal specificity domain-containing protein [Smithellaceae bacterium]
SDSHTQELLEKIKRLGIPLGEYVRGEIYRGVLTGLNEAFVIDAETRRRLIAADKKSAEIIKPFLLGRDIKRYQPPESGSYLIFMPKGWTQETSGGLSDTWNWLRNKYPAIAKYLLPFIEKAKNRCDKGEYWWELRACDYYDEFEKPKIILPDISLRGNFALDNTGGRYCVNTAYIISSADKYLLGILNSSLVTFFYKNISATFRGGYLRFIYQYLILIPIHNIAFGRPDEKKKHDLMVQLVDQMLGLHKQLAETKTAHEQTIIQRQIDATDKQIDKLVYELYALTPAEIAIVAGK